jgi:nicotinamide mononucleotide adenylyltransferase
VLEQFWRTNINMEKIHLEGDPKLKNSVGKQYSMFIGRWQPWHAGHRWLIDQRLEQGKNVLICIRDVEPDEKNPFTANQVHSNITVELLDLISEGKVEIIKIPDIESVNFGRGVGYDIIEHFPPQEVSDISATKIREQMRQEGKL